MKKIILTKGLPASGKSTWAREQVNKSSDFIRISKDDIREMLHCGKWSASNENEVIEARDALIIAGLKADKTVIVDDTNLNPKHLEHITQLVQEYYDNEVPIEIKDFTDVSLETCLKRDAERSKSVGKNVIIKMYNQYLRPKPKKPFNKGLLVIICDLDGTLCLFGDKNPYDRDFTKDAVNYPVLEVLWQFVNDGFKVIFVSGRKEQYREQTLQWLEKNTKMSFGYNFELFMRKDYDKRKDVLVKEEIYRTQIYGKYNILFVLDDRKQVKRFWVDEGLFVFDCNQYDEEF